MERKDKCVYLHKLDGVVVYVGSGGLKRARTKSNRSKDHRKVWDRLEFVIVESGLSIQEALELEQSVINLHRDSGKLFNGTLKISGVKEIDWKYFDALLYYDETSPSCLRWKVTVSSKMKAGKVAGTLWKTGYYFIYTNKTRYRAHRIIYSIMKKEDLSVDLVIYHKDRNRANNKIHNLLATSNSHNSKNKTVKISNTRERNIHERGTSFLLQWTDSSITKRLRFSYTNRPTVKSTNHYPSRELAFEAAVLCRDMLVDSGLIILN